MFKNLSTSTKLFVLCLAFVVSVAVPVYALVAEKRIAIDFARRELAGSRYLAAVREAYAAIAVLPISDEPGDRSIAPGDAVLKVLAEAEADAGAGLQTGELACSLIESIRRLRALRLEGRSAEALVLDALAKAQALAARIGDDSNLALDPDLDSYYLQTIVVRLMPTLVERMRQVQRAFEDNVETGSPSSPSRLREVRLPVLAGLLRSTAEEISGSAEAAFRGNADGSLKRSIGGEVAAMISSVESYLGAVRASAAGVDARDAVPYDRYHAPALENAVRVWAVAQGELDRLLQVRIDTLSGRMRLNLGLIGAFAALSLCLAALTHRHIVRPLRRLEAVAFAVQQTKDYSLRADYKGRDEIGRVADSFNSMLSELAAARAREIAERAEFARVSQLTSMGEMAASIAHEVNQPLHAIVSSGNAGLRWLDNETPDLGRVRTILQRVVRDGLRASEIVGSVRAMFKKEKRARGPLNVKPLIVEVLGHLHAELQSERISVQVELGEALPSVLADRVQLQQVLVNLVANGIDAMRSVGDRRRQLQIGVRVVESDGVLITVEDTGPGVAADARDRIFEPFFTTKPSGMGLGLSVCRSIIESHGGRVWASPGSPHGTRFQVVLPAYDAGGG